MAFADPELVASLKEIIATSSDARAVARAKRALTLQEPKLDSDTGVMWLEGTRIDRAETPRQRQRNDRGNDQIIAELLRPQSPAQPKKDWISDGLGTFGDTARRSR